VRSLAMILPWKTLEGGLRAYIGAPRLGQATG
jgi:hypothetical protein